MMSIDKIDALNELEYLLELEAQGNNFLARSDKLDLQLAAMRRWPRYEALKEIYLERCTALGRTPRLPTIVKPTLIEGGAS